MVTVFPDGVVVVWSWPDGSAPVGEAPVIAS